MSHTCAIPSPASSESCVQNWLKRGRAAFEQGEQNLYTWYVAEYEAAAAHFREALDKTVLENSGNRSINEKYIRWRLSISDHPWPALAAGAHVELGQGATLRNFPNEVYASPHLWAAGHVQASSYYAAQGRAAYVTGLAADGPTAVGEDLSAGDSLENPGMRLPVYAVAAPRAWRWTGTGGSSSTR